MKKPFTCLAIAAASATSLWAQHPRAEAADSIDTLVAPYLQTQQALAADNVAEALAAADRLATNLGQLSQSSGPWNSPDLFEAIDSLSQADDLDSVRSAFRPLSGAMLALIKQQGPAEHRELIAVNCSMAFGNEGALWIQPVDAIANPYYGQSMLRCGSIEGRYLAGLGYFSRTHLERIHGDISGYNTSAEPNSNHIEEAACGMSCCAK